MGKFTEYNVQLKGLSDGVHVREFRLGPQFFANMENTEIRDANVDVQLTIKVRGEHYDLQFAVKGEVVIPCDRCLDDLTLPIDTAYHVAVEFGKEYSDESDDLLIIPSSDPSLNVAYMIYDTVVLAIPMKHVHPMGKCNRQMTAALRKHRAHPAGEDTELEDELIDEIDNIDEGETDPRWDGLKGLSNDD